MPTFGKTPSRAPKGAAGNNFKSKEDGRGGRAPHRAPVENGPKRAPREKGAFFEDRPKRTYGDAPRTDSRGGDRDNRPSYGDRPSYGNRDGGAPRGDRPSYGDRPAYGRDGGAARGERPSYGDRNGRPAAGRTSPREMNGGRPDNGRDWTPRNGEGTGAPARKPRYNSDDRAARDSRPAYGDRPTYGNRDGGAPRGDRPTYGDRPSYGNRDDRGPRRDFGDRDSRPSYGNRDGAARGGDRPSYGDRPQRDGMSNRPFEDRNESRRDFASRDDRGPKRNFGDRPAFGRDGGAARGERPARSGSWSEDRNPNRPDRAARDDSRESTFRGARDSNPNKKAFFEDVVLERLDAVVASEAITTESFEGMGLHPKVLIALTGMGAETPFPIQASTIPAAMAGRDVLGRGKTGSGKTIAFTVPLVQKLIAAGSVPRKPGKPRALILAPTRELADQIDRTVNGIAKAVGFYTACIYGGVPQRKQENAMSRGVDIVVATPGRLEDLMAQRIIDLSEVETMVVDEADHMCDLGFIEGVRRIMRAAGDSQKLLFSATLDREVDALVKEFLPDPYVYEVPNEENDTANITHRVLTVDPEDRSAVLLRLVQGEGKSIIFTRTKMTAERLSESLTQAGVPAARLHGDLNQNQRNRNLERFTKGACRVLVATDVAARGIHVDDVALVVQVDPPEEYKTYLHRSGRTGRAGKEGTVITLIPRSRRRRLEDLLRRAERDGIFSEVRPSSELLEQLAGPIAPAPAPEILDFGDSRGGSGGGRGFDRDGRGGGGRGGSGGGRGNYGGSGKGRWSDKPKGEGRPRAKKFD
jgi:superfamily II DNA/RNA helicase